MIRMQQNKAVAAVLLFCASLIALGVVAGEAFAQSPQDIPRPEHPRPDFRRGFWLNLNGQWDFAFDREDVGVKEKWYLKHDWPKKIVVPFVHQSKLSGIGDTRHYRQVWYHRTFTVPEKMQGKQVRLHVGAADFLATVWVNGKKCGTYESGQVPFTVDVTPPLKPEAGAKNDLVIRVYDNELDPEQPRGKQNANGKRNRFNYTHLTGIWQTVWLEAVNPQHLDRYQAVTTIDPPKAELTVFAKTAPDGATVRASLAGPRGSRVATSAEGRIVDGKAKLTLGDPNAKPWTQDKPNLYNLRLELIVDGNAVDMVESYIGFRTVEAKDKKFYLNGRPVWLSGALDQGYWPQSLLTAPSDQAMIDDIQWVKRLGLNHIRKHQVVGDPRFLYHCDRLGLLVWGEMANAGDQGLTERGTRIAQDQWQRAIHRDFNHPSIVTWVYSNENWMHGGPIEKRIDHYRQAYHKMKEWDPTRPIVDTSGYYHVESDILDIHYYEPARRLKAAYEWAQGKLDKPSKNVVFLIDMPYQKQPIVVSEWLPDVYQSFSSKQEREWLRLYLERLAAFASNPLCEGHCYIQLYDVENERNGYLRYDRHPKISKETEATLRAAHLQAEKRDLKFDWNAFIEKHAPKVEKNTK